MSKENVILTPKQAMNPKGCGAGTDNSCFSLTTSERGFECSMITNPRIANIAGIRLGWRINVDESDQQAWCPLGVLGNSKAE